MTTLKYCTFKFILFFSLIVQAQSNEVYSWFDNQIKIENTALYNGVEFISTHTILNNKHRFFETDAFQTGDIVYDGQKYYNVPLRYDVYDDQLIVKIGNLQSINEVMLLKEKVTGFRMGLAYFEKLDSKKSGSLFSSGFYQLLTENENFKLYKKNHKKINRRLRDGRVFYEFNELNPEYVVQTKDGFFVLKRMRDLTSRYPNFRNELSGFRLTNKDYKSNDRTLIAALNRLNTLINN